MKQVKNWVDIINLVLRAWGMKSKPSNSKRVYKWMIK